jgi:probable HAF family extracellular repeat protein
MLTWVPDALAAGYDVQEVRAPGPAVRMSSAGYLTGTYQVKCTRIGHKPSRRICYYAPWIYDGQNITKVQWPVDWNYVYSLGINDSFELVGREYRGSLSAGGWLYSGNMVTYSGSLPDGGGSLLAAINNPGVAVGTAQTSARISRAATFQYSGGSYILKEVPAFASTLLPTTGVDINDNGDVTGSYTDVDGSQHAYAYTNGSTKAIPDLPGGSYCQAVRISQVVNSAQLWVAGNCGDRGFRYPIGEAGPIELNNLDGQSGGVTVQSVNGWSEAVGTVAGKAVMWTANNPNAIDLNQFTPKNVTLSRGIDINDDGTILASYTDSSGNVSTYLLTPTP